MILPIFITANFIVGGASVFIFFVIVRKYYCYNSKLTNISPIIPPFK